jgi:hypothetical protein
LIKFISETISIGDRELTDRKFVEQIDENLINKKTSESDKRAENSLKQNLSERSKERKVPATRISRLASYSGKR